MLSAIPPTTPQDGTAESVNEVSVRAKDAASLKEAGNKAFAAGDLDQAYVVRTTQRRV